MIANAVQCHSLTFMSLQSSFISGYEFLNLSRIVILVWQQILFNCFITFIVHDKRCYMIWKDQWITYWASIFPCCCLSYFSLVVVVEHSRRWWLHIGGSKMLAPYFKDEIASPQKWPFLACFWPFFGALDILHFATTLSPDVFSWLQGGPRHFTPLLWRIPTAYSIDKSKSQESVE